MSIYVPAYTPRSQGSLPPAARIKVRQTADTEDLKAISSDCYALPDSRDYPDNHRESISRDAPIFSVTVVPGSWYHPAPKTIRSLPPNGPAFPSRRRYSGG